MCGSLSGWLVGCVDDWLARCLGGCVGGWLAGSLDCWLAGCLAGSIIG